MNTRRTIKVIIALSVIGSAVGYLLYEAAESSWVYYYSVDEFVAKRLSATSENSDAARLSGEGYIIRLAGRVKTGTIVTNTEQMQLDFELAGQKNSVAVRFYGVVRRNFAADKEVVVEGKIAANGLFKANRILTRCESKYKSKKIDYR